MTRINSTHKEILEKTFDFLPDTLYNTWSPTKKAKQLNRERIAQRKPKGDKI